MIDLLQEQVRKVDDSSNINIYLMSDFSSQSWKIQKDNLSNQMVESLEKLTVPENINLFLMPTDNMSESENSGQVNANYSIESVVVETPVITSRKELVCRINVKNDSDTILKNASAHVSLNNNSDKKILLPEIPPGETRAVFYSYTPLDSSPLGFSFILNMKEKDKFQYDNSYFLSVLPSDTINALLVDGMPGEGRFDGQAGYLSIALSTMRNNDDQPVIESTSIEHWELVNQSVFSYDFIILAGVESLSRELWNTISEFVELGGGLIIFSNQNMEIENYNRFAFNESKGVLPAELLSKTTEDINNTILNISTDNLSHAVAGLFRGFPNSSLFSANIEHYIKVKPDTNASNIILMYQNKDPMIISKKYGLGVSVFVTTSANMDWTNLPSKGDFVSLVTKLSEFVSGANSAIDNFVAGELLTVPLQVNEIESDFTLLSPDDLYINVKTKQENNKFTLESEPLEFPGIYELNGGKRKQFHAVNINRSESNISTVDVSQIIDNQNKRIQIIKRNKIDADFVSAKNKSEFSLSVLILMIMLLLVEVYLSHRLSSIR